jgi:hypothetical protein
MAQLRSNCTRLPLSLAFLMAGLLLAGDDATTKPSAYAPAADVAGQMELFVRQMEMDLASETDYGDEQKERIAKDANTLIALAQVMGNHDQEHALRKAAPAVLAAAGKLADASGEFSQAKTALAAVKQAMQSAQGGEVSWDAVADLSLLMKQVPIVNNRLRAGVASKRFDRTIDQTAGLAATLAAIAQVSLHNTAYCSSKDEESTWARICADMRNAAAEVNAAVRKKDQATARIGLEKVVKTCDACHADFRD